MKKLSIFQAARSVFFMLALSFIFTTFGCKNEQIVAPNTNSLPEQTTKTLKMSGVSDVKGQFTVQNGILHFENSQALFDALEQLRLYDISERRNFGKDFGFKSMLSSFCDVLIKSRDIEDMDAYDSLFKENSDIIDYKEDGTFSFKTATPIMASVTNRNGIVYVGKSVYQFTDFGEVIIVDGDINRLSVVTRNTPTDRNTKVFITKEDLGLRIACGTSLATAQIDPVTFTRKGVINAHRQIAMTHKFDSATGLPIYDVYNSSYVEGVPFKWKCNIFGKNCSWGNYSTKNTLSMNQALTTYDGKCQYSDIFTYSNTWDIIDYGGNGCTVSDVSEADVSQSWSYFTSMNPNRYLMTNTWVDVQLVCN